MTIVLRKTFVLLLTVCILLFLLPGMTIAEDYLSNPGKIWTGTEAPEGAEGTGAAESTEGSDVTEGTEGSEGSKAPGKQESDKESFDTGMIGAVGAFAKLMESDDVCQIIDGDGVAVIETYDNFADALAAVESGQTIKLLDNINYSAGIKIIGKSITFDVNGYILSVTNTSNKNVHALEVGAGGEVWLFDSGTGGKFNVKGENGKQGVYASNGGKAEVTNVTSAGSDASVNAYNAGTEVTIYGSITAGGFYGLRAYSGATVTIHGNVNGGGGMYVSGQGTTVTVGGYSSGGGTGVYADGRVIVYVSGNVVGGGAGVVARGGAKVTVDGYIKATSGGFVYIDFGGTPAIKKMQENYEQDAGGLPVSQKDYYFEYNDGISYVWVKYFNPSLDIYTVIYDPGEQGEFEAKTHYGLKKDMATPAAPETSGKDGWTFRGWDPEVSATVTADATYTAQWAKDAPTYSVRYEPGAYGAFLAATHIGLKEGAATPSAPTTPGKEGWKFTGWDPAMSATVTEDVTYIAQWAKDNDSVTGDEGIQGSGSGGDSGVDSGNYPGGEPPGNPSDPPTIPSVTPPSEETPDGSSQVVPPVNLPVYPVDPSLDYSYAAADPPTPNRPGHHLIPNGLMSYMEVDDDGVPVGVWTWDEEAQKWIFDSFQPTAGLPKTGDAGLPKEALFMISLMFLIIVLTQQYRVKE